MGLVIADVPVVDGREKSQPLGDGKSQFTGRWDQPTPMGIIPARYQRDDDDDDDDDDDPEL